MFNSVSSCVKEKAILILANHSWDTEQKFTSQYLNLRVTLEYTVITIEKKKNLKKWETDIHRSWETCQDHIVYNRIRISSHNFLARNLFIML